MCIKGQKDKNTYGQKEKRAKQQKEKRTKGQKDKKTKGKKYCYSLSSKISLKSCVAS